MNEDAGVFVHVLVQPLKAVYCAVYVFKWNSILLHTVGKYVTVVGIGNVAGNEMNKMPIMIVNAIKPQSVLTDFGFYCLEFSLLHLLHRI